MHAGALLAIWHDVEAGFVDEYLRWHTFEHLPERLALPGFLRACRFEREGELGQRFMCIIQVSDPSDFESQEYFERLNAPSEWTRCLMPRYSNVHRALCRMILDVGYGVAPLACCIRFNARLAEDLTTLTAKLRMTLISLYDGMNITSAQLGVADAALSAHETEEKRLRRVESTGGFDYVLVVSAIDLTGLETAKHQIGTALAAFAGELTTTHYRFSYASDV